MEPKIDHAAREPLTLWGKARRYNSARPAMTINVDAVYEDGVLKPERPLALKDKAKVHVTIEVPAEETSPASDDGDPTGWKAAREFIGMWKDAPARSSTSLSEDHDQALYRRK